MALGNTGQLLVVVDEKARFETPIVRRPATAIDSHDPTRPRTWRGYSRRAELSDIFFGGLDELQVLYHWVVVVVERRRSQRKQWRGSARPIPCLHFRKVVLTLRLDKRAQAPTGAQASFQALFPLHHHAYGLSTPNTSRTMSRDPIKGYVPPALCG